MDFGVEKTKTILERTKYMQKMMLYALCGLLALVLTTTGFAQTPATSSTPSPDANQASEKAGDTAPTAAATQHAVAYPVDYCIVSGEKLGKMGDPVVKAYDGREVHFCCNGCVKTFEKDKDKYLKKLDDAVVAANKNNYPLDICVVSGEKLGGMGDPVDFVYQNQLVRFCCSNCIKTFQKDPQKYLSMLADAKTKKTETKAESK
jgi:YHS domain-containing protein